MGNPLRLNTNNKIPFFPFIFLKDIFGLFCICSLFILHFPFGVYSLSHPDNALEVCGFVTPLHIVPEWYFLCQYAMLKAVPNKNAGFIVLCTSICIFFFIFLSICSLYSLDRCSIPSREVSILWSYLDILLLFYSYVYLSIYFIIRISERYLFYYLQLIYWHFIEILWLFIFIILYLFLFITFNLFVLD